MWEDEGLQAFVIRAMADNPAKAIMVKGIEGMFKVDPQEARILAHVVEYIKDAMTVDKPFSTELGNVLQAISEAMSLGLKSHRNVTKGDVIKFLKTGLPLAKVIVKAMRQSEE